MDRIKETAKIQAIAETVWENFTEIFPKLAKFDCPKIVLNGRFSSHAGMCYYELNKIDISLKYYLVHKAHILADTLVHEIAHQVTYNLHGEDSCRKLQGHGVEWCDVMVKYGLEPNRYHKMVIPKMKLQEMIDKYA